MAFKLKAQGELLGYDEELSEFGKPVFEKKLDPGVIAEANIDGTIFVSKDATRKEQKGSIAEEHKHLNQFKRNELHYDNNSVTWKKDTKSPSRVYERIGSMIVDKKTGQKAPEGAYGWEWETQAKS
jgi:cobalamin biosynthesis protein CobT|tara:strand:- start:205 stop:582 length:378 start_codon:yes stop_codon:yes gene_type:complete